MSPTICPAVTPSGLLLAPLRALPVPPAVHCAVIDPGVGTDRDALVVRASHVLVAPDNGLAMPPARALAREKEQDENIEAFVVDVGEPASETFHGRDVFAPTAARIRTALDDNPESHATPEAVSETLAAMDDLSPATDPVDLVLPDPSVERDDAGDPVAVDGEVLAIDRFGNVVTNVPGELIRGRDWVRSTTGSPRSPRRSARSIRAIGSSVGSHGYVECDVNDGRGDGAFDLRPGESVRLVADNVSL